MRARARISPHAVYRYEYNDNVYVIPGNNYYAWRAEHYHGHLTHALLEMLLISSMYHALAYPRGLYYGAGGMYSHFGAARMPYYHSAGYQSHFGNPVRGANGAVTYPRSTGGPAGAGRVGTPVAHARPVGASGARPGGNVGARPSTPVAHARPVAHSRPVSHGGGFRGGRGRG